MNKSQEDEAEFLRKHKEIDSHAELSPDDARRKKHEAIIAASRLVTDQNIDNKKQAEEIIITNKKLIGQTEERQKRVLELAVANNELLYHQLEKEKRSAELNKVNRLYGFISQVNQNIVRIKDEKVLFKNACQIAFEFGKFKIAWIGLFDLSKNMISLVDQTGMPPGLTEKFQNLALKTGGPQEYVLQYGSYFISNNILIDAKMNDWKALANHEGVSSCIILPIKKAGNVIGTFNLYTADTNFFQKEEISLLEELITDIAFALDLFEKEKKYKQAQKLLAENERRFRLLIEKSADMITLSRADSTLLYSSPFVSKVLGYPEQELQNKSIFDIIHPDDLDDFKKKRNKLLQTSGLSFAFQHRLKHKNGEWVWCEGTFTNMLHESGIRAVVSNFRDISHKKKTEQQLEFDASNLNALINGTNDLIWSVDIDFNLVTSNKPFNDAVALTFGKKIEKGENALSAAYPAKQLKMYKCYYRRAFTGENFTEVIYFEFPVESWSEISFQPIQKGDEVIGVACHARDITERKLFEQNLKYAKAELTKSESRLKEAQAIAQTGSFETDLETHLDIWSDEMYKISGIEKTNIKPSHDLFLSFIQPDDVARIKTGFDECVRTFQSGSFDFTFIRKKLEIRYGCTKIRFEFDRKGKPTRLFGIFQDVTELKLAEIERTKLVSDLMLRNAELEQFGYIISHNLRAPIANIIGVTTALSDPGLDSNDKEILNIGLTVSALKLDNVVKDLNTILEIKKEIDEPKETVHLAELADDVKLNVQDSIDGADIEIKYDFSEAENLFSLKSYLHNIFYHLISNSIKYCRKNVHSIIEVKSKLAKNKIVLIFKDNGLGINLKKCGDKVFGLYNRFHTHIKGKGMGLFMVKAQVEALGGNISLKSEENKGTEVKIEFDYDQ